MKTAISIPDQIFEEAERFAEERGLSRSELYAQAVAEFVRAQRRRGVRERLNAVYEAEPSDLDATLARMQAVSLAKEDW